MNVADICQRDVVTIAGSDGLVAAAQRMREKHIGYLVVVDRGKLVGVVTDRDIVVTVVAREVDPRSLTVEDVMTRNPVTCIEKDSMDSALNVMRTVGVRRVPVIGQRGQVVGVLSLDDVLDGLAEDLTNVASSIRNQRRMEGALRP